ncbi:conserved hypothetical protein [Frankia canadensis]|uniref:CHK kinase-like domain-containing protein n=1 Tax=Frankia canadensis TaxID=1836972 RepID=A0A2I2L2Y2_9ACTN|nr:phosphotransferase [Frankia canadensis]SNQ52258.1 conserved hypothetical protein [Frankia canadensis]SOU59548.1 conserved hypothetical protein [Frankia canadensis]
MTGSTDPANPRPLPTTVEGLTAEWLTAALRTTRPGVTVASVEQVEVIWGTATKVLVALRYEGDAAGLPERIWVKGGFAEHSELVGLLGVYTGEVRFFDVVAPLYPLRRPEHFFALDQEGSGQGIVALEDLRAKDVTFGRATTPFTVEQVASGLEVLAALHGQSWGRHTPGQDGVPAIMGAATDLIWQQWFAALPDLFASPRAFAAPVATHGSERLQATVNAYRDFVHREATCLVHGDAHVGNTYLQADGHVGFLDWQVIGVGHWAHDVNYFLISALDLPVRREHERDLLAHYLKSLAEHGVAAPGIDDAWEDHRKATVYGYLAWLCNPVEWQPDDINTATFARFGAAMVDHDTFGALGQ